MEWIKYLPFIFFGYYLLINIIMYAAMAMDKNFAIKEKRRVPEKNFYLLAVLGGGVGGFLGMFRKRHKTRHMDFILIYAVTTVLHAVVIYFVAKTFFFS